ncbi:MAG: hypothetical protein ACR2GY_07980 [Phycisphaerales bacterium]
MALLLGFQAEAQHFSDGSPVNQADMELFHVLLRLTDDQYILVEALWHDYIREWSETIMPEIHTFHRVRQEIERRMTQGGADYKGIYRDELKPHLAGYDRFKADMEARDIQFFSSLASLLDPEQAERVPRAWNAKRRRALLPIPVTSGRFAWPEGGTDVIRIAYMLGAIPADSDDAWVVPHEDAYLRALQALNEAQARNADRLHAAHTLSHAAASLPSEQALERERLTQAGREANHSVTKQFEHLQKEIVRINYAFLNELNRHAGQHHYDRVVEAFRRTAFPLVYPDPASAHRLYAAAFELENLSDEEDDALQIAAEQFEQKHQRLSKAMERAHADIYRVASLGGRDGDLTTRGCWDILKDLGKQREACNELQWTYVSNIIGPMAVASLPAWDAGPRPWDTRYHREWKEKMRSEIEARLRQSDLTTQERKALFEQLEAID